MRTDASASVPQTPAGRALADFMVRLDGWGRAAADQAVAAIEREVAQEERERIVRALTRHFKSGYDWDAILAEPSDD